MGFKLSFYHMVFLTASPKVLKGLRRVIEEDVFTGDCWLNIWKQILNLTWDGMSLIQQSVVKLLVLGSPVEALHFKWITEIFWVFIKGLWKFSQSLWINACYLMLCTKKARNLPGRLSCHSEAFSNFQCIKTIRSLL